MSALLGSRHSRGLGQPLIGSLQVVVLEALDILVEIRVQETGTRSYSRDHGIT